MIIFWSICEARGYRAQKLRLTTGSFGSGPKIREVLEVRLQNMKRYIIRLILLYYILLYYIVKCISEMGLGQFVSPMVAHSQFLIKSEDYRMA